MNTTESLRLLPKVQLHCHLEGTMRAQTFLDLAQTYGIGTRYRPGAPPNEPVGPLPAAEDIYTFETFPEFLLTFAAVCSALRSPDDYVRLLHEYAQDARAHNVMYAELFVSPSVWRFFHPELPMLETFDRLWEEIRGIETAGGPELRLICDLTRNFGVESAMETAKLAAGLQDRGVVGIGLGGDEARFPAAWFADAFAYARAQGLRAVAHAGEAAGAASVHDAVAILRAERIGHGIRALEDPRVLDLLVSKNVPLEICPTSNYCTGVVAAGEPHPLGALHAAGVTIVLDTDDPAMFRTDLATEYAHAQALVGTDAVVQMARNAIDVSFAPPPDKARMTQRFERASAELFGARRS